ncbi:MAG TPA: DUF4160 domain-containing protein [Rhodopila sp.]|jgi:hypothetical protein|nr:DUF4160 domain-containing protein [Rhodopila sp.]
MPTIAVFYGIVITMFANDHPPPHFHATYGEFLAIIEIETGRLIRGRLPRPQLASVETWRQQHLAELMENWTLCRAKQFPKRIQPLP